MDFLEPGNKNISQYYGNYEIRFFESAPHYKFEELDVNAWETRKPFFHYSSVIVSIAYIILLKVGQNWMKNKPAYDLRKYLFLWNVALALYSAVALTRVLSFARPLWLEHDLLYLACNQKILAPQAFFWALTYIISKYFELIDTLFLVLRKKPVSFLHAFHHMSMLVGSVHCGFEGEPIATFAGLANLAVHSIMYTYFALKAKGFKLGRNYAMTVTSLQLLQFIFVNYYNIYTIYRYYVYDDCTRSSHAVNTVTFLASSYFLLFSNLFYQNYIKKRASTKSKGE